MSEPDPLSTAAAAAWFETPLGRCLLREEQEYFDHAVADVFGFNALQIGLPGQEFLRMSRIPLRATLGPAGPVVLQADPHQLPVASNSVDLVLLPHVLEFDAEPHQTLREVERILMPEGQVVISGFNPWSLWGLRRAVKPSRGEFPWCGSYINLLRIKDWLALLGFEVSAGRMCCYRPPVREEKWLRRFDFMEAAGDRWWAVLGGVYFVQAVKRVRGMRVITPNWKSAVKTRKALAPAAQRGIDLGRDAARDGVGRDIHRRRMQG